MLRFHQSESADDAKRYYTQSDYYLEEAQEMAGGWGGKAAERLGLRGLVDKESFDRLCDNLHPLTGEQLTARMRSDRTVGNDLTFDCPKSVSVIYELTHDARIRDAFRESVQETMRELEAEAKTRVRKAGADSDRTTGNLVWASFYHSCSRPEEDGVPDMNMHAHCFTFNCTWDADEKRWKAVQFRDLRRDAPYWEAAFQQRLATRLAGLGFEVRRKGRYFELEGVPESVIKTFSRRTQAIEEYARENDITDPKEKSAVGAKTRKKKAKSLTMEQLRREWVDRLSPEEFQALAELYERAQSKASAGINAPAVTAREALAYAADHLFERCSSVPAKLLLSEALRYGVGSFNVADAWRSLHVDGRFTAEVEGRLFAASREVLAEEGRLVELTAKGRATLPCINPGYTVQNPELTLEQRHAVRHLLSSRDLVSMVIGDSGAGKTTALKEALRGAEQMGFHVTALAPSSSASRINLRKEGFPDAETLAKYLLSKEMQAAARGQVILVDEAAMVGTKDMANLIGLAKSLDARLWLVGDDKQHKSVARGSSFALLQERAGVKPARITKIQRQKGGYKAAVELIRDKPREGFEKLCELGWVTEIPTAERYKVLAKDYVAATTDRLANGKEPTALVIAPTHAEGARVTAEIRSLLKTTGRKGKKGKDLPRLGTETEVLRLEPMHLTEAQRRDAANLEPGCVLQFMQNAPGHTRGERLVVKAGESLPLKQAAKFQAYRSGTLKVAVGERLRVTLGGRTQDGHRLENGDLLTVKSITPRGDLIDHRGWKIDKDFGHLAHGYVTTSYSAQSRTVDRELLAMGTQSLPAVSREQLYVSISRGRQWARIYTDDKEALAKAVDRSDERVSATEVASRRKSRLARWVHIRRHVSFLQRLARYGRDGGENARQRAEVRHDERLLAGGLTHEH